MVGGFAYYWFVQRHKTGTLASPCLRRVRPDGAAGHGGRSRLTREESAMQEFDYVVAGGGTAGAVVAARLSEDPNVTVCLLEAGPSDVGDQAILRLDDWMFLLDSGYDWDYPVEPQEKGNSFLRHARARVLGGCSSHNSCIAFWTPREDLDEWAAMGCEGWSADECFPLLKKLETNDGPGDHHGRRGPVNIRDRAARRPVRRRRARGRRAGRPADGALQRGPDGDRRRRLVPDQLVPPTTRGCRPRTRTCTRSWTRGRT